MNNEWISIIDWICQKSLSESGKKYLHSMTPVSKENAQKEFKMIKEVGTLFEIGARIFSFRLDQLNDIISAFENNDPLEAKDYRIIGDFLGIIRKTGEEINQHDWAEGVASLFNFEYNISFEMTIKQSINEKGEVSSNATPELAKIRKQLGDTHRNITSEIKKMILSTEYNNFLQEDWFTIRDDRYVLPFKSVFKRKMKGVIHNYSRTGQTAFLEPLPLIEHNNSLSLLAAAELEEIIKILKELRGLVHRNFNYLTKCIQSALHLESLHTKYKWMKEFDCVIPEFCNNEIKLENAWYPPVFLSAGKNTVKNNFVLSNDEKIMVISGPNAGGKTVALKTVSTIAELAMRGFPVPATSARLPFFDNIFFVLGDNQSAVSGESSFSSHLKQLSQTADDATGKSLVLIDEIGTGTDPLQGGAIARAYLEFIADIGCHTIVTSHLAEVKSIALEDRRFIPIAMGFDFNTDKPTYKFMYNLVGSSNALALVKKIGFNKEFIKKLEKLLMTKNDDIEPLINRLRKKEEELDELKNETEILQAQALSEKKEAADIRERLEIKEKKFEQERLLSLKKLVEYEEAALKKKILSIDTRKAPEQVALLKKEKENLTDAINRQKVSLDEKEGVKLSEMADSVIFGKTTVYDKLLKLEGILQQIKGDKAEYNCHGKKLFSPVDRLIVLKIDKEVKASGNKNQIEAKYVETCDVRGLFTEDAAEKIEKSLDTAYGGGAVSLTIIHGHGSGKLKKFIRDLLPDLKTRYNFVFDAGANEEGGDSVTVVRFNK
ncbi:MAG TPA: Smr/MutS family protein [bacterium]|nr:Smr/MutS family protein [bacterium]